MRKCRILGDGLLSSEPDALLAAIHLLACRSSPATRGTSQIQSTRRTEKLVETLGITRLSKSQVTVMAKDIDARVETFRTRPLDAGPRISTG